MKTEIVAKRYGRNLVVVIDGVKKTRVISTPEDKQDEELIKNKIQFFNKKNNALLKGEILRLVDVTVAEKEKVEARTKGIKKAIKKEIKKDKVAVKAVKSKASLTSELNAKDLSADDVAKLETLLASAKKVQAATNVPATTTKSPKRGEY